MRKVALFLAISVSSICHGEVVISCPSQIETKDVVASIPPEWEISSYTPLIEKVHKSNMSGFFYKENGKLKVLPPTESEPLPGKLVEPGIATWKYTNPEDIYIVCDYSDTDIITIRHPPQGTSQCTIRADSPTQMAVCK